MRFVWMAALLLVFASLASLISSRRHGELIDQSLRHAAVVLPQNTFDDMQRSTPLYTARVFAQVPSPSRENFAAKTWKAVELMIFRSQLVWHLLPALFVLALTGFLEGSWARHNEKKLIRMHSPMRFSLALSALGLMPVVALLWITAPVALSAGLLVLTLGTTLTLATRTLIVHAPTQF